MVTPNPLNPTPVTKSRCVLIPAAGYGRRVGLPMAKEMMSHPKTGRPLIEFALDLSHAAGVKAHIITRKEKLNLLSYLEKRSGVQEITIQTVGPTDDWPQTLLASEPYWAHSNIVCLPDTEFMPLTIFEDIFSGLEKVSCCFALAEKTDLGTYGVLQKSLQNAEGEKENVIWQHCEKPEVWNQSAKAWGLFGFRNFVGIDLLRQFADSNRDHKWRRLPVEPLTFELTQFVDLTRPNMPEPPKDDNISPLF